MAGVIVVKVLLSVVYLRFGTRRSVVKCIVKGIAEGIAEGIAVGIVRSVEGIVESIVEGMTNGITKGINEEAARRKDIFIKTWILDAVSVLFFILQLISIFYN